MKRKRQNKAGKFDPTKPILDNSIDIKVIGTEEDCFGKIHDPTDNECKMCGDSGLCIIIQAQTNRKKRVEIEKTTEFRDIAPKEKLSKKPAKKVVTKKKKK